MAAQIIEPKIASNNEVIPTEIEASEIAAHQVAESARQIYVGEDALDFSESQPEITHASQETQAIAEQIPIKQEIKSSPQEKISEDDISGSVIPLLLVKDIETIIPAATVIPTEMHTDVHFEENNEVSESVEDVTLIANPNENSTIEPLLESESPTFDINKPAELVLAEFAENQEEIVDPLVFEMPELAFEPPEPPLLEELLTLVPPESVETVQRIVETLSVLADRLEVSGPTEATAITQVVEELWVELCEQIGLEPEPKTIAKFMQSLIEQKELQVVDKLPLELLEEGTHEQRADDHQFLNSLLGVLYQKAEYLRRLGRLAVSWSEQQAA